MKDITIKTQITVAPHSSVVSIAIAYLRQLYIADQAAALRAIAAYFGYRVEKLQ